MFSWVSLLYFYLDLCIGYPGYTPSSYTAGMLRVDSKSWSRFNKALAAGKNTSVLVNDSHLCNTATQPEMEFSQERGQLEAFLKYMDR